MTCEPGDTLLYFPNHIHRAPNLDWKLQRGGQHLGKLDTERNHLQLPPPRRTSRAAQKGDSNNNGKREGVNVSWNHMLLGSPSLLPAGQPGRLYEGINRVRAHMVLVWVHVALGGKRRPGSRNPPILTSCFCWKRDPFACRPHQHRAQCSPDSPGNGVSLLWAAHHKESGFQHTETQAGVFLIS